MCRILIVTAAIGSFVVLTGCSGGEKSIPTVPVTGEVKRMSGEPVGNVTVVFYPKAGTVVTTKADGQGKFNTSVPVGESRVAVISASSPASTDMSAEGLAKAAAGDTKIDRRFASPDSSGLTADVKTKQAEKLVFVVEPPAQQ